jgi:hypothetical protein
VDDFDVAGLAKGKMRTAEGVQLGFQLGVPREDHPDHFRVQMSDEGEELGTAHPWHLLVTDDDVVRSLAELFQAAGAAFAESHFPVRTLRAKSALESLENVGFVIDE